MKILLLGEYSNVHWTLAEGLRHLGHEVCVASNGDFWKNYPRDISLVRKSHNRWDSIKYYAQVRIALQKMRGYDIVQIINPMFFELKAEKMFPFYHYLRQHNKRVFMGAYGMDYYWVTTCRDLKTFRYSDFNFGNRLRTEEIAMDEVRDWVGTEKERLNKFIADDCDGIIAGLYEYYACYHPVFPDKTCFIPFPVNLDKIPFTALPVNTKIKFFIGIQKERGIYKGTHIMLRALERVAEKYPDKCEIVKAESVPYAEYCHMMDHSHVLLDQLYSYTPAMNGLLAMAKGLVLVGGGEEENYTILGENLLRPIVNVIPDEDDVFRQIERLVKQPGLIERLSKESRKYIEKYHDYRKVAQNYIDFWTRDLTSKNS